MSQKNSASHLIMEERHMDKLYKSKNPLVRFFHNQRLNSILIFIPKEEKIKILDAGCGEGHLLEKINKKNKNASLYGIDITKVSLRDAKKRIPRAKLLFRDLTKLKLRKDFFDIVICSDVLEHIYEYRKVIRNLIKVTKKRGLIIISYPNEKNLTLCRFLLGINPPKVKDHVNSFNPKMMKKELKTFKVKQFRKINLPLNIPFIFSLESVQVFQKS